MKQKKSTKILYSIWFRMAILAAIFAALSILTDYDKEANYFLESAPVLWTSLACAAVSLISGIAATFTTAIGDLQKSPFAAKPIFLPTAPCFAIAIAALIFTVYTLSLEGKTILSTPLFIFTIISLALAAFYSILSGRPEKTEQTSVQTAGFGLFAILAPLLLNIYFYFDASVEMNAPLKLFVQIALLFAMLYYTSELRYLLGKPTPKLFLMLCTATVSIGSLCTLSIFTAFFTDRLYRVDYLAGAIVVIGVMVTSVIRMAKLFRATPTESEVELSSNKQSSELLDDPFENI